MSYTSAMLLAAAAAAPALAQTDVDPAHKMTWGENIGWMNWHDAGDPAGAEGARLHPTFLSGYIWSENVGWISLGDGAPASGAAYANDVGEDTGVNILPSGDLDGLAWGENIGWINFATGPAVGAFGQQARLDGAGPAPRLRGYAWGENVGWINLDHAEHYVAFASGGCYADCDGSGGLDIFDFLCFQNAFGTRDPYADCDGTGVLDLFDFLCFQNEFAAGCP